MQIKNKKDRHFTGSTKMFHVKHVQYFLKGERFYPSSQLYSECGSKQKMPLHLRIYVCKDCGIIIHRDFNVSKNIESRTLQLALA
jgi:transposase